MSFARRVQSHHLQKQRNSFTPETSVFLQALSNHIKMSQQLGHAISLLEHFQEAQLQHCVLRLFESCVKHVGLAAVFNLAQRGSVAPCESVRGLSECLVHAGEPAREGSRRSLAVQTSGRVNGLMQQSLMQQLQSTRAQIGGSRRRRAQHHVARDHTFAKQTGLKVLARKHKSLQQQQKK